MFTTKTYDKELHLRYMIKELHFFEYLIGTLERVSVLTSHVHCRVYSNQMSSYYTALFLVSTTAGVWKLQPTSGTCPPPLANHTFTKIDKYRAVAFGGYTGSCRSNDAYVLDMKIWVCSKMLRLIE